MTMQPGIRMRPRTGIAGALGGAPQRQPSQPAAQPSQAANHIQQRQPAAAAPRQPAAQPQTQVSSGRPIQSAAQAATQGGGTPIQRAQAQQPAARPTPTGWMKRGAVARAMTEQEIADAARRKEERDRNRDNLWRFFVEVGKPREIIILDHEPGPCFHEHNIKNPETGRFDVYETCPKEHENCCLCEGRAGAKPSYYVMLLTVIDLTPVYNDDNTVKRNYTRKTLAVKHADHGFFYRLFDRQGTLRGSHLLMSRDTEKSARYGRPESLGLFGEGDIMASFSHPPVMSTQQPGKIVKPENADCYALEYEKVIAPPDAAYLRGKYGGGAPMGSRQYNQQQMQQDEHGDADWAGHDPGAHGVPGNPPAGGSPIQSRIQSRIQPSTPSTMLDDDIPF